MASNSDLVSNIADLVTFIQSNKIRTRIEVEGKPSDIANFVNEYNKKYNHNITTNSDGLRTLHEDANKWGLQCRIYFSSVLGMPQPYSDQVRGNNTFDPITYPHRINNHDVVMALFAKGFIVGNN